MKASVAIIVGCVVITACTSDRRSSSPSPDRSGLTMYGSVPCPPGDGAVETWCDDSGFCEIRVVGGPTFSCDPAMGTSCTDAATEATEACQTSATGGDAGVSADSRRPATSSCPALCAACGVACTYEDGRSCEDTESEFAAAGCASEFAAQAACLPSADCGEDWMMCAEQSVALAQCACPAMLVDVRAAAEGCGVPFPHACSDGLLAEAQIVSCAQGVAFEGCAAFGTVLCDFDAG